MPRRKSTKRRSTKTRYSRSRASNRRSPVRRATKRVSRRRVSSGPRTIRIEVVQTPAQVPGESLIANALAARKQEVLPKKAKF